MMENLINPEKNVDVIIWVNAREKSSTKQTRMQGNEWSRESEVFLPCQRSQSRSPRKFEISFMKFPSQCNLQAFLPNTSRASLILIRFSLAWQKAVAYLPRRQISVPLPLLLQRVFLTCTFWRPPLPSWRGGIVDLKASFKLSGNGRSTRSLWVVFASGDNFLVL